MEKSIETIWKEGFLNNDALVAPKLNDLYNQKSNHIIDKFTRRFKLNLILIMIGSFVVLGLSFIVGIPVMGAIVFLILQVIYVVNNRLSKELKEIDKGETSYQYLKTFEAWMNKQLTINRKMASFYYPALFLSIFIGLWFSKNFQTLFSEILNGPHQIYLVNDFPILWTIPIFLIAALLAIFGGRLYNLDVGLVYGRMINKLEEMLADMKELAD